MCLLARNKTPLACITYCPCVMLRDLITCYSVESAWLQLLKLKCHTAFKPCFQFQLVPLQSGPEFDLKDQKTIDMERMMKTMKVGICSHYQTEVSRYGHLTKQRCSDMAASPNREAAIWPPHKQR